MVLKNLKHVEEFNTYNYFKELNLLIQDLSSNYNEMTFLKEAKETITNIETTIIPEKTSENVLNMKEPCVAGGTDASKNSKIPLNTFFKSDGTNILLTKAKNIQIYEHLLRENIKISTEDKTLHDIIRKSIEYIYEKKNANIEVQLIKFLNIDIEVLTLNIMHEFNNLIKYHPNTKDYNLHKTRFKLTTLSYNIGNIYLNSVIKSYKDPLIHQVLNFKENDTLIEYHHLLEEFQQHNQLKNNIYFQKIFKLALKETTNKVKQNITKGSEKKQINILNTLNIEAPEFSYKIGQYFYTLIKTLLLATIENTKDLHSILLKNKLIEYKIKLGSVFLHAFKIFNIFYENTVWVKKNKETILFVPNMLYFSTTISNIVHQRPYFSYGTIETLSMKYEKSKTKFNSIEYYLYHISNTRARERIHKNPDITMKPTFRNSYKKLKMFSGKYYMEHFETLTSFIGTIDKTYFYNFLLMLKNLLDLKKTNNNFTFEQNLTRYSNLFLLYKIKQSTLLEAYETNDTMYKHLLEHLFEYALDFNVQDNKYLLKELQENLKPINFYDKESPEWLNYKKKFTFMKNLYNKIYSYKLFVKGLLSECFIYTHFDYFIFDAFLDTRGRHYLNGFYLNPQSYPLIKAFVKPYILNKPLLTKEQFNAIKMFMLKTPYILESKEVSALLEKELPTYQHYLQKEEALNLTYIHSLFENTTLSIENLYYDLNHLNKTFVSQKDLFNNCLFYIKKYMTNLKKFFVLHSAILLYLRPISKIINYYELDATASGLQMTALVLRDATLGELCNLTPSIKMSTLNNDLYTIFSAESMFLFSKYFNVMCNINIPLKIKSTCYILYDYFFNKAKNQISKIVLLIKELKTLLAEELYLNFYVILDFIKNFTWVVPVLYNTKNHLVTKVLTKAFSIKDKKHVIYDIIYTYIATIGGFVHLTNSIYLNKEHNWFFTWLNSRDVFKKAIMTFGYNATSYRRKEQFFKALVDQNKNKQDKALKTIGKILNNLFLILKDKYLKSSQIIRDFGILLSRNIKQYPHVNSSILIDNGIFEIEIKAYKKKTSTIKVSGMLKNNLVWHELQINNPIFSQKKLTFSNDTKHKIIIKSYDIRTLARKFAPNFIHSMDAWLICSFKYKIALLNKVLYKNIFINNITNHDTFSITSASFLRYFLMDIYKNLYFFDYLGTLHHNYNYGNILMLWFKKILLNTKIRKLKFRKEAHLGSPVTIIYPLHAQNLGYKITFDMGASTNLILNPYFVK